MAVDAVVERFRAYLREHHLPITPQRLAIAGVLLVAERHMSAEEIEGELRARGTKAGTATVYRTLDVLVESGLVVERDFGEGFRRFEPARDRPHHEQLLCIACGVVEEFRDERLERRTKVFAEQRGFVRLRHRLVIYGVCRDCQFAVASVGATAGARAGSPS